MTTPPRRVTILGATGSVGRSTLDLIGRNPDAFEVVALTAHRDVEGLAELALQFRPQVAVVGDESRYGALKEALAGANVGVAAGSQAVVDAAGDGADWTMAAIVGCAGLAPTMAAIEQNLPIAV